MHVYAYYMLATCFSLSTLHPGPLFIPITSYPILRDNVSSDGIYD